MRALQQISPTVVDENNPARADENSRSGVNFAKPISLRCFCFISLLTLACVVLPYIGFFREDIQRALFPIFLLAFIFAPKNSVIRLPFFLGALAGLGWLFGTLHIMGVLRISPGEQSVFVTRLEEGAEQESARTLYRRFNEVARRYELPPLNMLDRGFSDNASLREWLNSQDGGVFALSGKPPWLQVSLSDFDYSQPGVAPIREYPELVALAENAGIKDLASLYVFQADWLGVPLVIDSTLRSFQISTEPQDLALHYLGWLAKGLSLPNSDPQREEYLHAASVVKGHWKSNEPIGVARYFAGLYYLADAYRGGDLEMMGITCAQEMFRMGSSKLNPAHSPESYAALFNNAAVTRVFAAYREYDFEKAYRWLAKAAGIKDRQGFPARGARLALVNMSSLYRSGMIKAR